MHQIDKTLHLTTELLKDFSQHAAASYPKITYSILEGCDKESFHVASAKGVVHINAQSSLAAAYGIAQTCVALKSGYLGEFLGESNSRFPLRPVWIAPGGYSVIAAGVSVALPRFVYAAGQDKEQRAVAGALFCRRLIELGYNAVVMGARPGTPLTAHTGNIEDVTDVLTLFHSYGLKVIIKPLFSSESASSKQLFCCPVNNAYRKWISDALKMLCQQVVGIDYLFWEGSFLHADYTHDKSAQDMTLPELVTAEVALWEQNLPPKTGFIYYLPLGDTASAKQQAMWMTRLCDDVGERTIIAFSAVAGDLLGDHLAPHPFWEQLRESPDISSTRLMPLVNVGMVMQGEGLWPAPALDLVEKYYSRLHRHRFAGVIALSNLLPQKGSMLDCSLWVAGQMLWRQSTSAALAEVWFRAFRTEWNFLETESILNDARLLVVDLSLLRELTQGAKRDSILSEDCRIVTESIFSRLKELGLRAEKLERKRLKRGNVPSLLDYMQVFIRDAQRIVLRFLQSFNLSNPLMGSEELSESFWMEMGSGAGQGGRVAAKGAFPLEPISGAAGSRMEAIFRENRLI